MFNFGPAYVGAQFQYGQNLGNARWVMAHAFKLPAGTAMTSTNDVTTYGWDSDRRHESQRHAEF